MKTGGRVLAYHAQSPGLSLQYSKMIISTSNDVGSPKYYSKNINQYSHAGKQYGSSSKF